MGRRSKADVQKQDKDNKSTSTQSTSSVLTEGTPIVEKQSKKQRKQQKKQQIQAPRTLWSDLCSGCCGAMEIIEPEQEEEDPFADEDNFLSKFGNSIMHKVGFAPPVKIIRCTQLDDDSVITTPKVLLDMAKKYDKERFWAKDGATPNDASDGTTVSTSSSTKKMRLLPSLSMSGGKSFLSTKSTKSIKSSVRSIKKPVKVSEGRFEI
ncbi:hypothetical protein ACHAXM_003333 [Skeletonema potamos]